jgi:hypothetical protein
VAGQETNTEDGTSTVLIYFALKWRFRESYSIHHQALMVVVSSSETSLNVYQTNGAKPQNITIVISEYYFL